MTLVGEHTRRVMLQRREVVQDPNSNEQVDSWVNVRRIYASFDDRAAREGQTDGQVLVVQNTTAKIRYRPELDRRVDNQAEANHRILDGGVVCNILSIVPEGRRKYQILTLERKDDN